MASNPYVNKVQLADGTSIIDISDTTAVASDVAQGKYFYTANGVKTAGTASGGGSPSATQHTIHLEFTDSTDTDIDVYYDDTLLNTMITSYTPETYGQKTVDSASLDNVTWYTRPTEVWETLHDGTVAYEHEADPSVPPYCWLSSLADINPSVGSVWRVTFDGVTYRLTAYSHPNDANNGAIGNPLYLDSSDDGSGVPFAFYHTSWGAWSGAADLQPYSQDHNVAVKIERLVTS